MITGYRLEVTWTSGEDSSAEVVRVSNYTNAEELLAEVHNLLYDTGTKSGLDRICIEKMTEEDILIGEEPW